MKVIFIPVFLCLCSLTSVSGQVNLDSDSKKLQFGLIISPDYCYRVLGENKNYYNINELFWNNGPDDKPKLGMTSGFCVRWVLSKRIGIETGLLLSNKGYQTFTYSKGTSLMAVSTRVYNNYYYLDFPVRFNISLAKGITITSGATLNIRYNYTRATFIKNGNNEKRIYDSVLPSIIEPFNISPFIGVGYETQILDNLKLRMEPSFRFGIIKTVEVPITDYLYNIGFYTSLFWDINN